MAIDKQHYIHSRGGALGFDDLSTLEDVDAIITALKANPKRHLILHFHGGLVSRDAGFGSAAPLLPLYLSGGHPVFYIWESGFLDAIRNNITELADEPVFKQLLRKLLEYTLKRLGGISGARSIAPGQVDAEKVKETLDHFIANPGPDTIPYKNFEPAVPDATMRSAALESIDEAEIQADLENDQEFQNALATLPDVPPGRRSAFASMPVTEHRSAFSEVASDCLSSRPGQRGYITLLRAALLLKDILKGILRRYRAGRDHGLYATVVEEIVRSFKLGGSGLNEWGKALQWNRMKQDCDDAFLDDPQKHAGTVLLTRIRDELDGGRELQRITLIGHSTGAIYIAAWLAAADAILAKDVKVDVVFLAPAISYERFAATLQQHGHRIRRFRMFAMSDALERNDQVWGDDITLKAKNGEKDWRRFIYPSSLLYLVSGILESKTLPDGSVQDEADMPIVGMQRYFSSSDVYDETGFPEVAWVRKWLQQHPGSTVWSNTETLSDGLNCKCNDHGAFDNEPETLASLSWLLTQDA